MSSEPAIKAAVKAGVAYIASQQLRSGGFKSFSSASRQPFQPALSYQTTFAPALILASLASAEVPGAQAVRGHVAAWLAKQASASGSFNYWAKGTAERRSQPYPDDLDDSFCALSALLLHDKRLVDEQALAKAVKLLLATETAVGGPYRTWLVPPDTDRAWLDVDVAVNSNVAYFLSLASQPLPNLVTLIDQAIMEDELRSPYYPSSYPLVYYTARGYSGQQREALGKIIRKMLPAATTGLELALSLSAAVRVGAGGRQKEAAAKLRKLQAPDGSWPAAAFCLDPAINNRPYYSGAPALTTAFALEALQLYSQTPSRSVPSKPSRRTAGRQQSLQKTAVLAQAGKQCQPLGVDLRLTTLKSLRELADSSNGTEIISLPHRFNQSLREPARLVSDEFLKNLGLANLYGWLAYTIYDDFLDEEGQPSLLPAANAAMRKALHCFLASLPEDQRFDRLVRQIFDTIDGANAWELAHCRCERQKGSIVIPELPDYGDLSKLAERSLGHGLALLAILSAQGFKDTSPAFKQTRRAFSHYLIVRQLSDDLHDWQTDITSGHVTYVVARILSGLHTKPGNYKLSGLVAKARKQFWYITLPEVCGEMLQHIEISRQAIDKAAVFGNQDIISQLLDRLETSTKDALDKQSRAENFLQHYGQKAARA